MRPYSRSAPLQRSPALSSPPRLRDCGALTCTAISRYYYEPRNQNPRFWLVTRQGNEKHLNKINLFHCIFSRVFILDDWLLDEVLCPDSRVLMTRGVHSMLTMKQLASLKK